MSVRSRWLLAAAAILIAGVALLWPGNPAGPLESGTASSDERGSDVRSETKPSFRGRGGETAAIRSRGAIAVRGRVEDRRGAPVAGATVSVFERGRDGPPSTAATGTDGAFAIEDLLPRGELSLTASAAGFRRATADRLPPPDRGVVDAGTIRLAASSGIAGIVQQPGGRAVADARVAVYAGRVNALDRITVGEGYMKARDAVAETRTDREGLFEIDPLEPGYCDVVAEAAGFAWEMTPRVRVVPGRVERLEIEVAPAPRPLEVVVVDGRGAPVAGADVFVHYPLGLSAHVLRLASGPDGRVPVPMPVKTQLENVLVRARRSGTGVGSESFRLSKLPDVLEVRLFATRALACHLRPDDGSDPPAGVRVSAEVFIGPRQFSFVAQTDSAGKALFAEVPEVDEVNVVVDDTVWCSPPQPGSGRSQTFMGDKHAITPLGDVGVTVPVTRTGSISGKVIDRTTGKPAPGVPIQGVARGGFMVLSGKHHTASATTDEAGAFDLRGLPRVAIDVAPRTTQWLLWPDGWDGGAVANRSGFFGGVSLRDSPRVEDVTVKVVASGSVRGLVVDAFGHPAEGVLVEPLLEGMDARRFQKIGGRSWEEAFTTLTDAAGRFTLEGLYPGPACRVYVRRGNGPPTSSPEFALAPGETREDLVITLPPAGRLTVEVTDPDGAPVAGVEVWAARNLRRRTGPDGVASFEIAAGSTVQVNVGRDSLPPHLDVEHPFDGAVPTAVGVEALKKVRLRLKTLVRGRLVLSDGEPLRHASLSLRPGGGAPEDDEHGNTAGDGSFAIAVRSSKPHSVFQAFRYAHVPKGVGASTDIKMETLVPAGPHELRVGENLPVVMKPK